MKRSLPVVIACTVLLVVGLLRSKRGATPVVERDARPEVDVSNPILPKSGKSPRRLIRPDPVSKRAEDFPHNLHRFDNWQAVSAMEMRRYRTSLIARVGRWDADEVEAFFFRVSPSVRSGEALTEFREAVLAVWCAKDVGDCLNQLAEHDQPSEAAQDALAGWAREDWMTALRYLQANGDKVVEAKAGGDASRFVFNLISEVARANGITEATEVIGIFRSKNNRNAARAAIEEFEK